jgi:hypothetical protein
VLGSILFVYAKWKLIHYFLGSTLDVISLTE